MYAEQAAKTATPRAATLNERLNKVAEGVQFQCERLEGVLARVNGTPTREPGRGRDTVAQISPTHPLSAVVEMLEAAQNRLTDLTNTAEQIA